MNNQTTVKWSISVGAGVFSLIVLRLGDIEKPLGWMVLANVALVAAFFLRRHPVAQVACLLSAFILVNGTFAGQALAKAGSDSAVRMIADKHEAFVKKLEDQGIVFQK